MRLSRSQSEITLDRLLKGLRQQFKTAQFAHFPRISTLEHAFMEHCRFFTDEKPFHNGTDNLDSSDTELREFKSI